MIYSLIQIIVVALGALQGLFLIITLLRHQGQVGQAHRVLTLFLSIVTLTLMANLVFVTGYLPRLPHVGLLMDDMFLLYGPLLYIYVGAQLGKPILLERRKWIHFILPGIHIVTMIEYALMSPEEFYRIMTQEGIWQYPYDQALAILSIVFYLTMSGILYSKYRASNNEKRDRSLEIVFCSMLVSVLLWANHFSVDVFGFKMGSSIRQYTNPWTLFPLITIFLGYYALGKSDFFKTRRDKKRYENSSLSQTASLVIKRSLEELMNDQRPFLNPRLTLDELSELLGVSKKDLSQVINELFEVNFFDFMNQYRIQEFKKLATPENLKKHNIMALAYDAGFNSKSAFNKVFKRLEGCTPSEFLLRQEA